MISVKEAKETITKFQTLNIYLKFCLTEGGVVEAGRQICKTYYESCEAIISAYNQGKEEMQSTPYKGIEEFKKEKQRQLNNSTSHPQDEDILNEAIDSAVQITESRIVGVIENLCKKIIKEKEETTSARRYDSANFAISTLSELKEEIGGTNA